MINSRDRSIRATKRKELSRSPLHLSKTVSTNNQLVTSLRNHKYANLTRPLCAHHNHNNNPGAKENGAEKLPQLQHENEVLRIKNLEMQEQIKRLEVEHLRQLQQGRDLELDCADIQNEIRKESASSENMLVVAQAKLSNQFMALETEVRSWEDKVILLVQNIFKEETLLKDLALGRQATEVDLWKAKMQNQGIKVVVSKLQKEIDSLRSTNQELTKKRKIYGPEEQAISAQIQDRVRQIKEKTKLADKTIQQLTSLNLAKFLDALYRRKVSLYCIDIRKNADLLHTRRRMLFRVTHIAKGYQKFLKHKYLSKFRAILQPSTQQYRLETLFRRCTMLKKKNSYFARWRKEFIKCQYTLIRKLEVLSSLDKVQGSYRDGMLSQAFNTLRHLGLDKKPALDKMFAALVSCRNRLCLNFFSALKTKNEHKLLENQIQVGSKYQTQFLIKGLYFNALARYVRGRKPENKAIMYKYFKILKKNGKNKNKRNLHDVLDLIVQKHNTSELLLKTFCAFRYATIVEAEESRREERQKLKGQVKEMKDELVRVVTGHKFSSRGLSMSKLGNIMNRTLRKNFYRWRRWNYARTKFLSVLEMLHSKNYNDKNLGFAKITRRRFQKLKLSIADKIKSCEFSYNYLTQQNAHIKSVLDKKTLQVEKTKFVKVIKKLIQSQHATLKRYLYRFLVRGKNFWEFKQTCKQIDNLMTKKIKQGFMFIVKTRNDEIRVDIKKEHRVSTKEGFYNKSMIVKGLKGIAMNHFRAQTMKKILIVVFSKNLEFQYHGAFLLLKKIFQKKQFFDAKNAFKDDSGTLKQVNDSIEEKENSITNLRASLRSRNEHMKDRIVIAAKLFFTRYVGSSIGGYITRWRKRAKHDKNLFKFATTLQTKLRIAATGQGFFQMYKWFVHSDKEDLEKKFNKFSKEFDESNEEYNNLAKNVDDKIKQMHKENAANTETAQDYKIRLRTFNKVKIDNFNLAWGKMFSKAFITKWKAHVQKERVQIEKLIQRLAIIGQRVGFQIVFKQIKEELLKQRVKANLDKIYTKNYLWNVNQLFQLWRDNAYKSQVVLRNKEALKAKGKEEDMEMRMNKRIKYFEGVAAKQFVESDLRKYFYAMRTVARTKAAVKQKAKLLRSTLRQKAGFVFMKLFNKCTKRSIILKKRKVQYQQQHNRKLQSLFIKYTLRDKTRRQIFKDKFLQVFLPRLVQIYSATAFANIKQYGRAKQIHLLNIHNNKTQRMIGALEHVFRIQLGRVWRSWRKTEYIRDMRLRQARRLVRKAMNNRIEKLFFSWKLEAYAKSVLIFHHQEGEVKKREREFQRTKRYIQQFKKLKGLLLQNQQGHLVLSPRFMEKKQVQERNENTNRYKVVSRLLLMAGGEHNTIRAWNNLRMYYIIRQKVKHYSSLCNNYLRRPECTWAFRRWRDLMKETREKFDSMPRNDLIKILQKQKDKIEIEYSKKLSNEQHMNQAIKKFEVLERASDIKEKLCGLVIIRAMRGKKESAFQKWRSLVRVEQETAANQLEMNGDNKLSQLENELALLEQQYHASIAANRELKETAMEGLDIAEAVKRLTLERDELNQQLTEKALSCQALLQENINLTNKYKLASQEAQQLLSLTKG